MEQKEENGCGGWLKHIFETAKQNIFIHEFTQPKHVSNPLKLTVQKGDHGQDRQTVHFKGKKDLGITNIITYHEMAIRFRIK